jgi:ribosome-associated protein
MVDVTNFERRVDLESLEMARKMVEAALDKQASDIVLMNTAEVCSFADYFVICSGETERQLEAIRRAIDEVMEEESISPHHREGTTNSGWILLDYGSIVVHIFSTDERNYYQLDQLWNKAALVIRIQ